MMATANPEAPLLRLLVLSDLRRSPAEDWWQTPRLDALADLVGALRADQLGPDAVVLAGDATATGSSAEFALAATWLRDRLLPAAGLPAERLYVVPGERDVHADIAREGQDTVDAAVQRGESDMARLLGGSPAGKLVLERLKGWRVFYDGLRPGSVRAHPWWSERLQEGDLTLGLAGLCSAWACVGADVPKAPPVLPLVGLRQVNDALEPLQSAALCVVIMHHPAESLHSVDRVVMDPLHNRAHLVLHGHTDRPRFESVLRAAPSRSLLHVAPGPLNEASDRPGHAAVVELHADRVRVRSYITQGERWVKDLNRALPGHEWAELPIQPVQPAPSRPVAPTPAPAPPPASPLPPDPYPVLAPYEHPATFGGRHDDTPRLLDLLQRERLVCALYAASGAGKSSLLRAGLIPALKARGERVVYWDQPAVSGLGPHLLRLLDPGPPAVADDDPVAFAAALASLRDQGQRPFLILDQLEEIFASPPALARLGACIAATAMAPAGRACRWVLVYREDFHGRVLDWLADVRRFNQGLDPGQLSRLPAKLDGPETLQVWSIPLLGDVPGAPDRLDAARAAFQDAIERPLKLLDPDGQPHYPYRIDASHAERLALAFARARMSGPLDPLTPELQVVLDHLIGGRRATRQAPLTLTVPEDPAELDRVVSDAIGAHLRLKLEEVGRRGGGEGVAQRMTSAMLLLMRLADDTGLRQAMPIQTLRLEPSQRAVLEQLKARGVWLVREELRDGEPCLILPHDRIAAEINRIQRDPVELQKYKLDTNLVELWGFVAQRAAAWTAGDEAAVELSWRRYNELERQRTRFPWDEGTRAWWCAAERARERVTRSWVRWGALVAVVLLVFLGGVWVKLDMGGLESAVFSQPAASGEPLRALYTLMTRYHYDGAELAGVLGASGEAGSTFNTGTRDEIFGVGPAGLTEAERLAEIPPLVEVLAPHVEGATDDESFYGALLAAVEVVRFQDTAVADTAKQEVVKAMRKARGQPPAIIPDDGQWTIPIAGTFEVGCLDTGDSCQPNETRHAVTLTRYRVHKYEETIGQYQRFDKEHLKKEVWPEDWPVFSVNWYEASAYAAWLGTALPTEAQWEVATRGGCDVSDPSCNPSWYTYTAYWSGPNEADLARVGFFSGTPRPELKALYQKGLWPAKTPLEGAPPHPLGLLHVHGNAIEWVADWYGTYPATSPPDPRGPAVPAGPADAWRVLRGGSCSVSALNARSAYRYWFLPSVRFSTMGFRLALPEPKASTP